METSSGQFLVAQRLEKLDQSPTDVQVRQWWEIKQNSIVESIHGGPSFIYAVESE